MNRYLALFLPFLIILFIGVVIGFVQFRHKRDLRPIIVLFVVTLLSEILSYYMAKVYRNNMPLAHFFNPIQLCIWAWFYYNTFKDRRVKKTIVWVTVGMLLFAVLNTLYLQPLKTFPDNFIRVETMLFIILGSYLFLTRLDVPGSISIFKDPLFVTAVAVLWFNLLAFLFFLLYGYMSKHGLPARDLRTIHMFTNYIYYLLLITALVLPQQKLQHAGKI